MDIQESLSLPRRAEWSREGISDVCTSTPIYPSRDCRSAADSLSVAGDVRWFRAKWPPVCKRQSMTNVVPEKPSGNLRNRVWKIAGATLVLVVLSVLILAYASDRIYRYISGIPEDTVVSRTTAEPGMLLARRGYDLRIPGEDWYYRYDRSGAGRLVELRRLVGDESEGGFRYSFAIMEWLSDEEASAAAPAERFERDRAASLRRSSDQARVETRLVPGPSGEVLVTEGTDSRGRTFSSRRSLDMNPAVPCYAQHVRNDSEWMGEPVMSEEYICTFNHPDSADRYVLTVTYAEAGAPFRQPTEQEFLERAYSMLAHITLRDLDPAEFTAE